MIIIVRYRTPELDIDDRPGSCFESFSSSDYLDGSPGGTEKTLISHELDFDDLDSDHRSTAYSRQIVGMSSDCLDGSKGTDENNLSSTHKLVTGTLQYFGESSCSIDNATDSLDGNPHIMKPSIINVASNIKTSDDAGTEISENGVSVKVVSLPYLKTDDRIQCVLEFDSSFRNILDIYPITPTVAWVYNLERLRLIDIGGKLLFDYPLKGGFLYLQGTENINEVLLLDHGENKIIKVVLSKDTSNQTDALIGPLIDMGTNEKTQNKIKHFLLRKSGDIVVCVSRKLRKCGCIPTNILYIQIYSRDGLFLRETKLQHNGTNLTGDIYAITENNNGHICLAGNKDTDNNSHYLVDLDIQLREHFFFDGNESDTNFFPTSLATTRRNDILFVNNLEQIQVIDENGKILRNILTDSFISHGRPERIATDREEKLWIVTSLGKILSVQLK
ncbi:uncharacterized protein [Mytilus edulis]|uniref:Tripartite motif-containing protein 2 n=1 Tax=Mytilus edulis TaxID=6550 RepID=A0A8S3U4H0_MYTED|nr:unnamed protein product [Mytilus edulis]